MPPLASMCRRPCPQGSSLSPLLFNLFVSDIPKWDDVLATEYADDVAILVGGKSVESVNSKFQNLLTEIEFYFQQKSLLISSEKSKAMLFYSKRSLPPIPPIKINGTNVEFVQKFKYLGITLDSTCLSWKPHIQELAYTSKKRANILKAFSARSWGADKKILIMLYKSLVLSKLNYGAELIGNASRDSLSVLDKFKIIV